MLPAAEQLVQALDAFLAPTPHDPAHRGPLVMSVLVAPANVEMAGRIVARMQDDTRRIAIFPHPTEGDTPEEYFANWAAAIDQDYRDFEPEIARMVEMGDLADDGEPALPRRVVFDRGLPPESAFVAWVERLAERSQRFTSTIVLVTYSDDELPATVRSALRRFGQLIASRHVRLIVLDASSAPLFQEADAALDRVVVGSMLSVDADAAVAFRNFVRSDVARVLIANGAGSAEQVLSLVPRDAWVLVKAPYQGRQKFESALAAGAASWLGGADWLAAPEVERWDALALALEAAVTSRKLDTAVLAIDASPSVTPSFLASWAQRLAAALPSSRTKVVILEDSNALVRNHLKPVTAPFVRATFSFGAASAEAVVGALGASPTASGKEKLVSLLGLAGFASAKGETDAALANIASAAPLATTADERASVAAVHGNTLYRAERFDEAAQAYADGLESMHGRAPSPLWAVQLLTGLGNVGFRKQEHDQAAELYAAAQGIMLQNGHPLGAADLAGWRGEVLRRAGKRDEAAAVWAQAIERLPDHDALEADAQQLRANLLERLARLRSDQGDAGQATALREQLRQCGCAPVVLERP